MANGTLSVAWYEKAHFGALELEGLEWVIRGNRLGAICWATFWVDGLGLAGKILGMTVHVSRWPDLNLCHFIDMVRYMVFVDYFYSLWLCALHAYHAYNNMQYIAVYYHWCAQYTMSIAILQLYGHHLKPITCFFVCKAAKPKFISTWLCEHEME